MTAAPDYRHVSILWATPEHAADCADAHGRLFDQAWDAPAFEALLSHPASVGFVARFTAFPETAGFVLGLVAADEAEILSLGVASGHQRHGIATRLIEALGRAAKRAGAERLFLEVEAGNAGALALYRKLGFEETGRRKGYYEKPSGPPADAIALALRL